MNQADVSASFFFARSACISVMAPALTISSIRLSFGISRSVCFALRILWIDDDDTSL
jgi:hypothetical protein